MGPLIGGALADLTGSYRIPFYCTSATILLPPALVWFAVDEPLCGTAEGARQPVDPQQPDRGSEHAGPVGVAFRAADGPIRGAHSAADRVPVYGLLQCRRSACPASRACGASGAVMIGWKGQWPRSELSIKRQGLQRVAIGAGLHRVRRKILLLPPAAAAEIGDPAKDASAGEALPITGSPALKTGRQPEKPNDAGGVSEQTSGSSDRNPGTPQTSPEKSPQVPWARHCSETPLRSTKRTDRDGALIRADMPSRERSNSGEGDVRWIELHGGPCGSTTIEQATDK